MSTANSATGTHILVIPYPAQGHMLPLLDLTSQLALRGCHITILVTPNNLSILDPILSAHPSIQTLILPFPCHPKLPAGAEHLRDVGNRGNAPMIAALSGLIGPITDWIKAHPSPPRAILSDFFMGWTQHLGLPRICFFSSGSFVSAVVATLYSDVGKFRGLEVVEFTEMPRSPAFKEEHLPSAFRLYNESEPEWGVVKDGLVANLSSWGCVFNSFSALEGDYLEHFKKLVGHGRVYGVGPISLIGGPESLNRANPNKRHVLSWLEKFETGSVLYVSFGSQKWLTQPQLEALGSALERGGTPFIWVVRAGPYGPGLDGFEERVAGRGLVLKGWAPQVEILGHRAVGGFLTHCGWNSVVESVVAGVVMLAWPMEADQYVNARLLVEDMGAAVRACEGPETVPDPDELGRVIREAMGRDVPATKQRAKELMEKALAAVKDGGSSKQDLDGFVVELARIGAKFGVLGCLMLLLISLGWSFFMYAINSSFSTDPILARK